MPSDRFLGFQGTGCPLGLHDCLLGLLKDLRPMRSGWACGCSVPAKQSRLSPRTRSTASLDPQPTGIGGAYIRIEAPVRACTRGGLDEMTMMVFRLLPDHDASAPKPHSSHAAPMALGVCLAPRLQLGLKYLGRESVATPPHPEEHPPQAHLRRFPRLQAPRYSPRSQCRSHGGG